MSPSRFITAGISVIRTMKASKRTATASAKPIDWMSAWSCRMNAAKTEIMMIAAAVTTRALKRKPSMMECFAEAPWT